MAESVSDRRFFVIGVLIVAAVFLIISIANAIAQYRIWHSSTVSGFSKGEAETFFWVNVAVGVIALILLLWSLWRILFTRSARDKIKTQVTSYVNAPQQGFLSASKVPDTYLPTSASDQPVAVLASETSQVQSSQVPFM